MNNRSLLVAATILACAPAAFAQTPAPTPAQAVDSNVTAVTSAEQKLDQRQTDAKAKFEQKQTAREQKFDAMQAQQKTKVDAKIQAAEANKSAAQDKVQNQVSSVNAPTAPQVPTVPAIPALPSTK